MKKWFGILFGVLAVAVLSGLTCQVLSALKQIDPSADTPSAVK